MEKRIGAALVLIRDKNSVSRVNTILSSHGDIIIGRQGLPLSSRNVSIISIVLEGSTDKIGSLTGQLGRLQGVHVKSMVMPDEA
ncbi:MAG: CopG family transcriptional regulator [Spirochaetes bacterium]|nr:CopG family transcriptional regulator [Spirochaetota bacterium]